jgi:hypothetical protein
VVNPSLLNHPAKVYPLRVGSAGAVIAEPGWAVIAVIAVPPLVLKVMVTFAIDEGVEEDELEVTDDVEELEDVSTGVDVGVRLVLEEEFENVIKPRNPIAVTITDPPINQNQKGFLRFLSVSSTTSMTFSMMFLSSFMVNISFKDC